MSAAYWQRTFVSVLNFTVFLLLRQNLIQLRRIFAGDNTES